MSLKKSISPDNLPDDLLVQMPGLPIRTQSTSCYMLVFALPVSSPLLLYQRLHRILNRLQGCLYKPAPLLG